MIIDDPRFKTKYSRRITNKRWRDKNKSHMQYLKEQWEINNPAKPKIHKKKWYLDNIDKQNGLRTKRRGEIREFINGLKKDKPCIKCDIIFDPICIDFHHPGDKEFSISYAQRMCLTNEAILEEVAKCDIMCANCHRLEHNDKNFA